MRIRYESMLANNYYTKKIICTTLHGIVYDPTSVNIFFKVAFIS